MRLFSGSLNGETLEWFMSQEPKRWTGWKAFAKSFLDRFAFNIEIVPDRYSLDQIKQKSVESFQDYAFVGGKKLPKCSPPCPRRKWYPCSLALKKENIIPGWCPLSKRPLQIW
ncbi:hypothetical protein P3L10_023305 [Capsicum annuum]